MEAESLELEDGEVVDDEVSERILFDRNLTSQLKNIE